MIKSTAPDKRLILPDLLKGFAVIFMIMVHVTDLFSDSATYHSAFGNVIRLLGGPLCAPVFLIFLGYFTAMKARHPLKIASRGLGLLFWGILLNIGLNFFLLLSILTGKSNEVPWKFILGADLLPLAGLSLLLIALAIQLLQKRYYIALILGFLLASLPEIAGQESMRIPVMLNSFIFGVSDWSYFPFFPWAGYVLVGFAIGSIDVKKILRPVRFLPLMLPLLVVVILFFSFGFSNSTNLSDYYHHGFGLFLWILAVVLVWVFSLSFFPKKIVDSVVGRFLVSCGKHVTAIYVIQWLLIGNAATLWFFGSMGYLEVIVSMLVVIALSSVAGIWLGRRFHSYSRQKLL
ncbi:MAG: DUF1624 domain-containing protein [Bacteroidetes bacterium]|nr:DUF1624 domain-containing protein [Bacteroidota bacterium]MBU1721009.1 DUF1624 domain-containing protein [Bacteroidota bacterium]